MLRSTNSFAGGNDFSYDDLLSSFLGETEKGVGGPMTENHTDFLMASPTEIPPANDSLNTTDDYYYDYDYGSSDNSLPIVEFVVVLILYGFTLILGFVGNALVIIGIAFHRRLHSVTNLFLISLASADLLLVSICIPIKFAKFFTFTWTFGQFLCKGVHYMQNVSVICSVLTLTTMSMERYYAILHPMRARYMCTIKRTGRLVIAVWVLSFVLAIPIIFGQDLDIVEGKYRTAIWCQQMWGRKYKQVYALGNLLLILIIPVSVMIFAYASIGRELWVVTSRRVTMRAGNQTSREWKSEARLMSTNQSNGHGLKTGRQQRKKPSDDDHTRKQVIRMLVLIVVLFVVCWAPTLFDQVLAAFEVVDQYHHAHLKYVRQALAIMSYFNSCINPIVYAFMSKNFRSSFKHTMRTIFCLKSCSRRKGMYQPPANSYQSRTTSMTMSMSVRPDREIDPRVTLASANFDSCIEEKSMFSDSDTNV